MTGIGIDTGGTCTDAVIYDLDTKQVLASAKSATTHERLEIGIGESLGKLPAGLVRQGFVHFPVHHPGDKCLCGK